MSRGGVRRPAPVTRTGPRSDSGSASVVLPLLLWAATVVAIVGVDVGAYLVAAARSQALADASALAAVSADIVGARPGTPLSEAVRVATAGAGRLESCTCRRGSERATVAVSVEVPGLVVPRLGASRVTAEASAVLAPPVEYDPGPTRHRATWPRPQDTAPDTADPPDPPPGWRTRAGWAG